MGNLAKALHPILGNMAKALHPILENMAHAQRNMNNDFRKPEPSS